MAFTEATEESWLSRILGSVVGAILGPLLFLAAVPLLFWNEGRAVKTMMSLEEGQSSVVRASADSVSPQNEHKLVYVAGTADTQDTLRDPDFGVKATALRLARRAEMFQWREHVATQTHKKLGGGEETVRTYTYDKSWVDHLVRSDEFKEAGHPNPGHMPYASRTLDAEHVTLGAFKLIPEQVAKLGNEAPLAIEMSSLENAPKAVQPVPGGVLFIGESPQDPKVGDQRIRFQVVKPGPVSVLAEQVGDSFAPYATHTGQALLLVADGLKTPEQLFQTAEKENAVVTWLLRGLGWLLMFAGLSMLFRPLSVLGDVIPFIGTLIGAGTGAFAFLLSAAAAMLTVAVAWIAYRPLLGVPLLVLSAGAVYLVVSRGQRRKAQGWTAGT